MRKAVELDGERTKTKGRRGKAGYVPPAETDGWLMSKTQPTMWRDVGQGVKEAYTYVHTVLLRSSTRAIRA